MSSPITLSGFGTFDASSLVSALIQQDSQPIALLQQQQQTAQSKISAFQTLSQNVLSLRNAADSLADPTLFSAVSASSSNNAAISAVGSNGAATGSYNVQVTTLAKSEVAQSHTGYSSDQAAVGTGSLTINIGSSNNQPITIDSSNNTLSGLRDAINNANLGVTASIVNTGNGANPYVLVLSGNTAGASNTISVSGTLGGNAFTIDQDQAPQSASLTVNGVQVTSDSNTVSGAIPGVTLNLNQENSSAVVTVAQSTSQIQSALQSFVNAYNTLNSFFSSQSTFNQSTQSAGILSGDSTMATVRNNVHDVAIGSVSNSGAFSTLTDLGIEFQEDGTMTLNTTTLNDALTNHLSDVQNFLQGASANGFANQLQSMANTLTDPISGILPATTTGLQTSINNMQDSINDLSDRLDLERTSLTAQFSAAQQAISDLQSQGQGLSGFNTSLLSLS